MQEDFLQYIWKNKLFRSENLIAITGEKIEILNIGELNTNSGPDFFNSKIKIDDKIWAGNVEIHVNSSDWDKHNHSKDKNYDNVILHVVYKHDKDIFRSNSEKITTLKLDFDEHLFDKFLEISEKNQSIPCSSHLHLIDSFTLNNWATRLVVERIESKSELINELLQKHKNNWEEIFYQSIAKSFGFKINSFGFEQLTNSLELKILAKHKNDLHQIEALLFGQAGLLEGNFDDEYFVKLKSEYSFLKQKYNLKPIAKEYWKFMRTRPANFPTLRISQFANLIFKSSKLFSKILEAKSVAEMEAFFDVSASEYWENHFIFGKKSSNSFTSLGKNSIELILINTVIPILFLYAQSKDDEDLKQKSIDFLMSISAEQNKITKDWKKAGVEIKNAFFSQAYIQLSNEYCNFKKCLHCQIGNKIIKNGNI